MLLKKEEEISLFDPSTLVKKGKDNVTPTPIRASGRPHDQNQHKSALNNVVHNNPVLVHNNPFVVNNNPVIVNNNPVVVQNNPVVTSIKKEFDFSHFMYRNL